MHTLDEAQAFHRATARVRARIGLILHICLYVLIGLLLLVLNLVTSPESLWFLWPTLSWLLALVIHAGLVIGPGSRALERWQDREYRRELNRLGSCRDMKHDS